MYADLHMHSYYSDGTESPAQLVESALNKGVKVLSLTDHDTLRGVGELLEEAKARNLKAVPGVEISTASKGASIHILGYYIDVESAGLQKCLAAVLEARTENTKQMFDRLLQSDQLNYSWERVLHHSRNKDAICSADVFSAMKEDAYFGSWGEFPRFYYRYFGKASKAYVCFEGAPADKAVEVIREAGGLPVVAHPKLVGNDRLIVELVDSGVKGIEVYHPAHDDADMQKYLALAKRYNLLVTGGSDWHGEMSVYDYAIGQCGINQELFNRLGGANL